MNEVRDLEILDFYTLVADATAGYKKLSTLDRKQYKHKHFSVFYDFYHI